MVTMSTIRRLSPEDKEKFHQEAETRVKPIKFSGSQDSSRVKEVMPLIKSDLQKVNVQIIHSGGENNLHYHSGSDTTWLVLSGCVRFYGPGDSVTGEFSRHEGLFMPGGARYWFEKVGQEPLEILQIVSYDRRDEEKPQRINIDIHKDWMQREELKVYE